MTSKTSETYIRFTRSQRIQHILMIFSFTMLALTGMLQALSSGKLAQVILSILGGLDGVRMIHHLCGILLITLSVYHVINFVIDLIFSRPRSWAMFPSLRDAKDAIQSTTYLLGKHDNPPQYDRFDFRQKMEYWALVWGTILMGLTGLTLMFPLLVAKFLPGVVIYAAKAAHGLEAFLAIMAIIVWHMYNTHFVGGRWNFDKTIFTGKISRERMIEEHPLEYQRLTGESLEALPDSGAEEE